MILDTMHIFMAMHILWCHDMLVIL